MGKKTTSKTEKDSFVVERLTGSYHYKTTISNGDRTVEARGRTAEEAERRASDKWGDEEDEEEEE